MTVPVVSKPKSLEECIGFKMGSGIERSHAKEECDKIFQEIAKLEDNIEFKYLEGTVVKVVKAVNELDIDTDGKVTIAAAILKTL